MDEYSPIFQLQELTSFIYLLQDAEKLGCKFEVSPLESEETRIVILDKKNKKVIYKEMGSDSWLEGSSMMFSLIWSRYREGAISRYGDAENWREWAESDRNEFLLEDEEEHEKYTVRAYDIEVDEPIDDSVFTPNGS